MHFELRMGRRILQQMAELPEKEQKQITKKLKLIKRNPYRFKSIHSNQLSKVFRVRINLLGKEMRLIYVVIEPNIIVACLFDRNEGYGNLEKYLAEVIKDNQDLFLLRKK